LIKVALDNDGKPVTQCKRSASSWIEWGRIEV
jgi:hypothetical protein